MHFTERQATGTVLDGETLPVLARGAAVLGAGGGGNPHVGLLIALQAVEDYGPVPLVDLSDLDPEALIMSCGKIGAPTVSLEKFVNGDEGERLRQHLEALQGRPVAALMCGEIGGSNGLVPVAWSSRLGLPLVDADGMGRAFPELPMVTMELAGIDPCPSVMTDERGNVVVFRAVSGKRLERLSRAVAVEFGGSACSTYYPMTARQALSATVPHSVSLAIGIGRAVGRPQGHPLDALIEVVGATRLIGGKVVDVERRTTGGFVRGSVTLNGLNDDEGRVVRIYLQNENLVALEDGRLLASAPDLICIVDSETADAITTERVRYGQRVTAIAFPCDPVWRTPAGIALVGPRAFGYDHDYVPVEELARAPRSTSGWGSTWGAPTPTR